MIIVTAMNAMIVLTLTAAGGLMMVVLILSGKRIPGILGIGHGLGGLIGVALVWASLGFNAGVWSGGVLTAALVGGLVFFRFMFRKKPPFFIVMGHGLIAAVGIYLLYTAI